MFARARLCVDIQNITPREQNIQSQGSHKWTTIRPKTTHNLVACSRKSYSLKKFTQCTHAHDAVLMSNSLN